MIITVNAIGDSCPIPVIKTKKAIEGLNEAGVVETLVDNEVAVQNLTRMANQKGYGVKSEKLSDGNYKVTMEVTMEDTMGVAVQAGEAEAAAATTEDAACVPDTRDRKTVVVISSDRMGAGNDDLGKVLVKGFIYALTQLDTLPTTMIFYNGGATLTCEDAPTLADIKSLEAQGVEVLTCGTCLNYYGLTEKLQVGEVTNMYVIAEKMSQADKIIKPC